MNEPLATMIAPRNIKFANEFVPLDYRMDPATEDLVRGTELKNGMVVLIEDTLVREDPLSTAQGFHTKNRVLSTARWCMVSELYPGSVLTFVGVYADGTKMSRMYSERYYWYVKY